MLKFKKLLSLFCVLSIVASLFVSTVSAEAVLEPEYWDGTQLAPYNCETAGESADHPIIIMNAKELNWLVHQSEEDTKGKYYKIVNDIYVNEPVYDSNGFATSSGTLRAWPKGYYQGGFDLDFGVFAGNLDGQGHRIIGLYNSWAPDGYWGLFGTLAAGATVKNVNIDSAYYKKSSSGTWDSNGAGIAGKISGNNVTITGCTNYRSTFELQNADTASGAGIVGVSNGATGIVIDSCGSYLNFKNFDKSYALSGWSSAAGILGNNWGGGVAVNVKNCWSNWYLAGIPNTNCYRVSYTNCYSMSGPVDASGNPATDADGNAIAVQSGITIPENTTIDSFKGNAAKATMPNLGWDINWKTSENEFPVPRIVSVWDGTATDTEFQGQGTEESPYLITSAAELAGLVTLGRAATTDKYYRLTTNVDISAGYWFMSNTGDNETNVFNGTFDGDGHTVNGLKYYTGADWAWDVGAGLFPAIYEKAHIKNVRITNVNINGWSYVMAGGIFGRAVLKKDDNSGATDNTPIIEYCSVSIGSGQFKSSFQGGIGGAVYGGGTLKIANCSFIGNLNSSEKHLSAAVGKAYQNENSVLVSNFYASAENLKNSEDNGIKYTDCYTTGEVDTGVVNVATQLTAEQMTGEAAAVNMAGFDFDSVWQTVDGGMPTLRVFNDTTFNQAVLSAASCEYGNGTKFVARFDLAGNNADEIKNGVINARINGENKIVDEIGIIVIRVGASEAAFADVHNDPLTGYKAVGYKKGAATENSTGLNESNIIVSVNVRGTKSYNAKAYTLFTDGITEITELYTAEPVGTGSADGLTVTDIYNAGDANFDGKIDILDLVRIKKYASDVDFNATVIDDVIDFDNNGSLQSADLGELRQMLLNGAEVTPITPDVPTALGLSLAWNDEFDTQTIDESKWTFESHMGGASDLQTETGSNVQSIVKNSDGESFLNLRAYNNGDVYKTVKSIATNNTFTFKYGYIEMRAKVPYGQGAWPSLWLKSNDSDYLGYGSEIDMVEVNGNGETLPNIHIYDERDKDRYNLANTPANTQSLGNTSSAIPNDNDWHTYGMLWTEDKIVMYIDGNAFAEYVFADNNNTFGPENYNMDCFRQPMYLIINNHIITNGYTATDDGTWAAGNEIADDFTESLYDIDYVRVFQ